MTNTPGGLRFEYFIAVKDKKGDLVMSFHDENGDLFASEQAALARVGGVEREYPGFKVSIEKSYVVNLDADADDAP